MQLTDTTRQWLPREVVESAVHDGDRFIEAFSDARFLLIDVSSAGNRLLAGLMACAASSPFRLDDEPVTQGMSHTVTRLLRASAGPAADVEREAHRLLELAGARAGFVMALDHRVRDLKREQVFLGRHSDCDVVLKHASVSKHHAVFSKRPDGALLVYDTESKNGTWVNGDRLLRATALWPGDRLRFGDVGAVVCTAEVLRRALTLGGQRAVAHA